MLTPKQPKGNVIRCLSKEEVFYKYLQAVNGLVKPEKRLVEREMELLSYICTQDPLHDQLVGTGLNRTMLHFPKLTKQHIGTLKYKLREKGWLQENGLITSSIRNKLLTIFNHQSDLVEISINLTFTNKTVENVLNESN